MCRALTYVLEDTADNGLGFSVQGLYSVLRAPWCMHEFKKGGRPMKHQSVSLLVMYSLFLPLVEDHNFCLGQMLGRMWMRSAFSMGVTL